MPKVFKKQSGSWVEHTTWKKLYKKINGEWRLIGDNTDFYYVLNPSSDLRKIIKYSENRTAEWEIDLSDYSRSRKITTDIDGNLYLAAIDSNYNLFLLKYDPQSNILFGLQPQDYAGSITALNTLYVAKTKEIILSGTSSGIYVTICFDANGLIKWTKQTTGSIGPYYTEGIVGNYIYAYRDTIIGKYNLSNGNAVFEKTISYQYDEENFRNSMLVGFTSSGNPVLFGHIRDWWDSKIYHLFVLIVSATDGSIVQDINLNSTINTDDYSMIGAAVYNGKNDRLYYGETRIGYADYPYIRMIKNLTTNPTGTYRGFYNTEKEVRLQKMFIDRKDNLWIEGYDDKGPDLYSYIFKYLPDISNRIFTQSFHQGLSNNFVYVNGGDVSKII